MGTEGSGTVLLDQGLAWSVNKETSSLAIRPASFPCSASPPQEAPSSAKAAAAAALIRAAAVFIIRQRVQGAQEEGQVWVRAWCCPAAYQQ